MTQTELTKLKKAELVSALLEINEVMNETYGYVDGFVNTPEDLVGLVRLNVQVKDKLKMKLGYIEDSDVISSRDRY